MSHGNRLGSGGGLVQEGRICHVHPSQVEDHGLKVCERLEPTLCDLRLIRRVGGVPRGVLQNITLDERWREATVVALPDKVAMKGVAARNLAQLGECGAFALSGRKLERFVQADRGGDGIGDEGLHRGEGEAGKESLDGFFVGTQMPFAERVRGAELSVQKGLAWSWGGSCWALCIGKFHSLRMNARLHARQAKQQGKICRIVG